MRSYGWALAPLGDWYHYEKRQDTDIQRGTALGGHSEGVRLQAEQRHLTGNQLADTLVAEFPPPGLWEDTCLLFKPLQPKPTDMPCKVT